MWLFLSISLTTCILFDQHHSDAFVVRQSIPFEHYRLECPQQNAISGMQLSLITDTNQLSQDRTDMQVTITCESVNRLFPRQTEDGNLLDREDCAWGPVIQWPQTDRRAAAAELPGEVCAQNEYMVAISRILLQESMYTFMCCKMPGRTLRRCSTADFRIPTNNLPDLLLVDRVKLIQSVSLRSTGNLMHAIFCEFRSDADLADQKPKRIRPPIIITPRPETPTVRLPSLIVRARPTHPATTTTAAVTTEAHTAASSEHTAPSQTTTAQTTTAVADESSPTSSSSSAATEESSPSTAADDLSSLPLSSSSTSTKAKSTSRKASTTPLLTTELTLPTSASIVSRRRTLFPGVDINLSSLGGLGDNINLTNSMFHPPGSSKSGNRAQIGGKSRGKATLSERRTTTAGHTASTFGLKNKSKERILFQRRRIIANNLANTNGASLFGGQLIKDNRKCSVNNALRQASSGWYIACGEDNDIWQPARCPQNNTTQTYACMKAKETRFRVCCPAESG